MNKDQWVRVKRVISEALSLEPSGRTAFITEACSGDPELLHLVREQLRYMDESEEKNFLHHLADDRQELMDDLSRGWSAPGEGDVIGKKIGSFRITERLGSGGMGIVYKAERADGSFEQTVAVKLIKQEVVSEETILRFKTERDILARLTHPHIARLYDGGITDDGTSYLVMEYIDGKPIDAWCDENKCSIEKRLRLFRKVCEAVQFAHQNMVIHRDLKPQNILVTDDGQVNILDFGIAKMLKPEHPGQTMLETAPGSRLWTPQFAAPEQIMGANIGITTDVYALGALLYTLLGGSAPYNFANKSPFEVESAILKNDPPAPGKSAADADLETAQNRGARDARHLQKMLKGDLDALILKALRRQPRFRYPSVRELLDDLKRYEADLPLQARQGTIRYRTSKFWKRHKAALLVAVVFAGIITNHTVQVTRERNRARMETQKAQEVSNFLSGLFRAANPIHEPVKNLTAGSLLERGKTRIKQLDSQPAIQAELLGVIGRAYLHLGQHTDAKPLLARSLELRQKLYSPDHPEVAEGFYDFANLQREAGHFKAADSLHRRALAIRTSSLGYYHQATAESLHDLGLVLSQLRAYPSSDSVLNEALAIYEEIYHPGHVKIAAVLNRKAANYRAAGNYEEAHQLYQRSFDIWKREHRDAHPQVAEGANDLALIHKLMGNIALADSLYRVALKITDTLYNGSHPSTAETLGNLGVMWEQQGDYEQARSYLEEALAMCRSLFREHHPKIAEGLNNLATLYFKMEKY